MKFTYSKDGFYFDGKKTKIISGAMHYFRVFPEYWEDRLLTLKELGANTVETYSAWNLHEKEEGNWDFTDRLDLSRYIETANKLGLYVILRPGPYICSECDMGGLPWWLLKYDDVELRAFNERFLQKTEIYLKKICQIIKPHLITNGGNVIMIQVENEYGCFGKDKRYLNALKDIYLSCGIDVPLVTCDWEATDTLSNGSIDGTIPFVNYRWDSETALKKLDNFSPNTPKGVMELWNGKALLCGKPTEKRDLNEIKISIDGALKHGEFMNLYMYHGGTNFGFFNGGQYQNGKYVSHATSYDVQTPLGEYGNKTEKYYLEQKIICDFLGKKIENTAKNPELSNYGNASFRCKMPISELDKKYYRVHKSDKILPMEKFNQAHGCIAYTTTVQTDGMVTLGFNEIHDHLSIYADGELIIALNRDDDKKIDLNLKSGIHELTFFVQESGRINFGKEINDPKGLIGDVTLCDAKGKSQTLKNYTVTCFPFDGVDVHSSSDHTTFKPALYKYEISLTPVNDTYLEVKGFNQGFIFINGFNLGRIFPKGPQRSFYVPKRLLLDGVNEIVVFDNLTSDTEKQVILSGKQIIDGYTE